MAASQVQYGTAEGQFDPTQWLDAHVWREPLRRPAHTHQEQKYLPRSLQFVLAAATQAVQQAGLGAGRLGPRAVHAFLASRLR